MIGPPDTTAALVGMSNTPVATVQDGALVVLGQVGAGSPCFDVRGAMLALANELTVKVTLRQLPGGCLAVVTAWQYRVTQPLQPGTYRVRVVHEQLGAKAVTALSTVIEVL